MANSSYNPDVLNCIANLSNDEVFTPPELANRVLDLLPQELFTSPDTKFLDPFTKSGVFLREIVKRLDRGLESQMPDRQLRIDHILHNQVFGIAITELTSYLSRRSLYCSKHANGKYSVSHFTTESGNILYVNRSHTWENGKCKYCGASQQVYDRGSEAEQYAYMFIHTDNPKQFFGNMKFDVIIGNPPYQLSDGGDTEERQRGGAIPLYHKFIQQAKKLKPRYLTMIVPSRWFAGGRGLDDFRDEMLHDNHLRVIVDYPLSSECFPGVEIKGGVCYFLWNRYNEGLCNVTTVRGDSKSVSTRSLLEKGSDTFIRYNEAISILRKVQKLGEHSFASLVSSQKPFGFRTFVTGKSKTFEGAVKLYANKSVGFVNRSEITQNAEWVDKYKVYITMAYGAGEDFPHQIINVPFLGEPNSCCTETYVMIGPFVNESSTENVVSYIKTRFFRFLVLLKKNTQHAAAKVYQFVPLQDFSHPWTDEILYKKYNLTEEEITFIESMIRPME